MEFPQWVIDRVITRQGVLHPYDEFDSQRTAFVIIDLQNYYTQPGFLGCCPGAESIFPAVNRLARAVRGAGGKVVWVKTSSDGADHFWSHHHRYMLTPERSARRLQELHPSHAGYEFPSSLDVHRDDTIVVKRCYSALSPGSSPLNEILKADGIDTVLIGGTVTNVCCESTARDAMMMDYRSIMVNDALAAFTEEEHIQSLHHWILYFGDVLDSYGVIQRLGAGQRAAKQIAGDVRASTDHATESPTESSAPF